MQVGARHLGTHGFCRTKIQLTEWNYGLVDQPTAIQRAAFAADSLFYMQDSPLQRAFYYRATGTNSFALINSDGTLTKPGEAYQAAGSMNATPVRLATTGGDQNGLAVEAGRSFGEHSGIRVLISNYEIPAADQGPFPPFIVNNMFAIPGIGTFTLLPRRSATYAPGIELVVVSRTHDRRR